MESHEYRLYSGHLRSLDELPPLLSYQVKIFVSCNATEFCEERDAIFSRVIPRLRLDARNKFGLDLHYLDLKFGVEVPEESDFQTREFMLKELLRCQKLSAGPNFVVLCGQKYGYRPVPHLILSNVFDMIHTALLESRGRRARAVHLLEKWYSRDNNSIPAVHVLQQPNRASADEVLRSWKEEKESLKLVLMYGVELCCRQGTLPPEALRNYFASDLENEVKHGIVSGQTGAAVSFCREITDIDNYLGEYRVTAFTETEWNAADERWQRVEDSKQLLDSVKMELIDQNIEKKNISSYSILWRYDSGVHPVLHKDYIDSLCQDVYKKLSDQILDAAAVFRAKKIEKTPLYNEVLMHWRKALLRGQDCQGRDNELELLNKYLVDASNDEFFAIYGVSGSGKTTIISKLLLDMESYLSMSTIVVVRYIGSSQESSNIRNLLQSICRQIVVCLGLDLMVPMDYQDVVKFFKSLLTRIPPDLSLVLLLDSVNNLQPEFRAHQLGWLPRTLPRNVKVVISCRLHEHGILTRIKTEIIQNPANCLEICEMSEEKAMMLILHWLQLEQMCVTNDQAEVIRKALQSCSLPLYIRLLFEEVRKWRSFDTVDGSSLGTDCQSYLNHFFSTLELKHGATVVKHALAYLTASKTGLSDTEMEDLLSTDEDVLSAVYTDTIPATRRCPPFVWARLSDDLDRFLVMKESDECNVYFWFHSFMTEFVQQQYLADNRFLRQIHHKIADYYMGRWYGKVMEFKDIFGKVSSADRQVISQPLTYENAWGEVKYNKRKYDQVPRHLYLANRLQELDDTVLFNYSWLYNKIKVLSLQHILTDLSLNPGTEATLLEGALRASQSILDADINNMPIELSGRLLPYYHSHPNIRKLIQQCDIVGLNQCALVPMFSYHQVPGSPLQHSLNYTEAVHDVHLLGGSNTIVAKANHCQTVREFDLATGESKRDIITSYGRLHMSKDGKHLVVVDSEIEKSIKVHCSKDGAFEGQFIPMRSVNGNGSKRYILGAIDVSTSYLAVLVTTDSTYLCIGNLETCGAMESVRLENASNLVHIASNERYVLCSDGTNITAYDLLTLAQTCLTQLEYRPTCMTWTDNSTRAFYTDERSHVITNVQMSPEGYTQMVSKINLDRYFIGDKVQKLSLSNDGMFLLVMAETNIVIFNMVTDRLALHIRRPSTVLTEFRLPKQAESTSINYTSAMFSPDDTTLITSLFRNVHFWSLETGQQLDASILAPVGKIAQIIAVPGSRQIVTTQQNSPLIQVWSMTDTAVDMKHPDKLTSPVEEIKLTKDNSYCFATGSGSDEVAVIHMASGTLTSLLTHECHVEQITPNMDGSFLFVTLDPSRSDLCNKIWSVSDRRMVHEFGKTRGSTCALRISNTIVHISQTTTTYKFPYTVTIFTFEGGIFHESTYDFMINHVISEPFVTADDTYLVFLTADHYDDRHASYTNPSICTLYLKGRLMHSIIGREELGEFLDSRKIIALVPITYSQTEIIAIYEPKQKPIVPSPASYGYVIVDLATNRIVRYNDHFLSSNTLLRELYLDNKARWYINSRHGRIVDMLSGEEIGSVNNLQSSLVLLYDGLLVAYYQGPVFIIERLKDNRVIARCNVHSDICAMHGGSDEKTLMVGCVDGAVLSYVVIDPELVDPESIVKSLVSRKLASNADSKDNRPATASTWDRAETSSLPTPSRATSAYTLSDRAALRHVRPVYKPVVNSAKSLGGRGSVPVSASFNGRSQTCSMM